METLVAHIILPLITCSMLFSCLATFVQFVSSQNTPQSHPDAPVISLGLLDLGLVVLFILQHKVMSTDKYKRFLEYCGITVVERLIHVAVTSFTLMTVMYLWEPITSPYLWYFDTSERFFLWLFFLLLHVFAWTLMLLDAITMEPLEMLGLKQIYNYHMELGPPLQYLPKMLQRCYRSVRHPGPVLLVLALWVHPQMTLDRLVLSYLFTWFLWCGYRMSSSQYRHVSHWLLEAREEVVFHTRHQVSGGRRLDGADSGCEVEYSE
ncbi:nurim-like [Haliotis rufescens]|uniref:nurim-like n=1 Tax=Haliotis rufescens TaxID=6454 RepID=UPI001EB053B2|nr:nurim-like [Haliotis rufescens]